MGRLARFAAFVVLACGMIASASGCSWITEEELDGLRTQVEQERLALKPIADPYRIEGLEFAVEVDKAPLFVLVDRYNDLSSSDRTINIRSYDRSGHLKRHRWFRCPWPLSGHASWFIDLISDEAFVGQLILGRFQYSWHQNQGMQFSISATALAAAAAYGAINNCFWETPITYILAVGYAAHTFKGHTEPLLTGKGAEFEFRVTSPRHIQVIVAADIGGIGPVAFPLREDPLEDLGSLELNNIVDEEGELRVDALNLCRDYKLDATATDARILKSGLAVGGKIDVDWKPAAPCEE